MSVRSTIIGGSQSGRDSRLCKRKLRTLDRVSRKSPRTGMLSPTKQNGSIESTRRISHQSSSSRIGRPTVGRAKTKSRGYLRSFAAFKV